MPALRDSRFAPAGQTPLVFGGRSRAPSVEIAFAQPGFFIFTKLLVFLAVLLGGVLGLRAASGRIRGGYVLACIALPLLLLPVSAVGMAEVLTAALIGGLLAGLFWFLTALNARFRGGPEEPPPLVVEPEPSPPPPPEPAPEPAPKKKAPAKKKTAKKATKEKEE
jgi:hypothetical protein